MKICVSPKPDVLLLTTLVDIIDVANAMMAILLWYNSIAILSMSVMELNLLLCY